jgi:hypothetical protein
MPRYHCLPKNPSVVIVAGENTSLLPRDDVAVALAATKIRQKTATRARAKDIAKPIGGTSPLVAFYAPSLYEALRRRSDFSGSELNIEGAAFIVPSSREAAKIRFFQRGNGAADTARGLSPKSSTAEIVAEDVSDTQFGRFCCC